MICFEFLLNEFISKSEFVFIPNASVICYQKEVFCLWQIALQHVRQGETIDATIRSAQSIEPMKNKVDSDELGVDTGQKENSEVLEGSDTEKVVETCMKLTLCKRVCHMISRKVLR